MIMRCWGLYWKVAVEQRGLELLSCSTLYLTDVTFTKIFSKTNPKDLNENGKVLRK